MKQFLVLTGTGISAEGSLSTYIEKERLCSKANVEDLQAYKTMCKKGQDF